MEIREPHPVMRMESRRSILFISLCIQRKAFSIHSNLESSIHSNSNGRKLIFQSLRTKDTARVHNFHVVKIQFDKLTHDNPFNLSLNVIVRPRALYIDCRQLVVFFSSASYHTQHCDFQLSSCKGNVSLECYH